MMTTSRLPQDQQDIDKESRKLAKAWLEFQACLPNDLKSKVADKPPGLADVYNAVNLANEQWKASREQSKFGRVKSRFAKLCGTLDDYKALLAIIPSSDKYVCLLTGSLSAMVKVRRFQIISILFLYLVTGLNSLLLYTFVAGKVTILILL